MLCDGDNSAERENNFLLQPNYFRSICITDASHTQLNIKDNELKYPVMIKTKKGGCIFCPETENNNQTLDGD